MARTARIVLPGVAHHVTQRGNKKQPVFFDDRDRRAYLCLLKEKTSEHGLRVLAYCLMTNHVHLVVVPAKEDSLAKAVGEAHLKYTAHIKRTYEHNGHLWQNRFYSCPMDEQHTLNALFYVELNPVRAGMVKHAWHYGWSSARAHSNEDCADGLLNLSRWRKQFSPDEWRASLASAVDDEAMAVKIRTHTQRGRPLGDKCYFQRKTMS